MVRYGILIDLRKCIGCNACTIACRAEWHYQETTYNKKHPEGVIDSETGAIDQSHFWNVVGELGPFGTWPDLKMAFMPRTCFHCKTPACIPSCPISAIKKEDNGIVWIDPAVCQGIKLCHSACPYSRIYWNPTELNAGSSAGLSQKCIFCAPLVTAATPEDPACVSACMTKARYFGDIEDSSSDIAKMIAASTVVRLNKGTEPSAFYILPANITLTDLNDTDWEVYTTPTISSEPSSESEEPTTTSKKKDAAFGVVGGAVVVGTAIGAAAVLSRSKLKDEE